MKEPETIIYNMSKCLNSGKEPEKGRAQWCGEVWWDAPTLETLHDIPVYYCWNEKKKTILFSCSGFFCYNAQKSSTHNTYCYIPRIGVGKPSPQRGVFLVEDSLLSDLWIRVIFLFGPWQFKSFLLLFNNF